MALQLPPDGPRALPTLYRNVQFRSKLEADWARAFDAFGMPWRYERDARYWTPTQFYCPDFLLLESRQYVEVKGVFQPDDCRKIAALLENVEARPHTGDDHDDAHRYCPDVALIACRPKGEFYGFVRGAIPAASFFEFLTTRARRVTLFRCTECAGHWFADPEASHRCQCCGIYDRAARPLELATSPLVGWPLSPDADRGAWDAE